ncbi:MAG: Mini-ribonuclease 3 [Candidatus Coproplasma sp.]
MQKRRANMASGGKQVSEFFSAMSAEKVKQLSPVTLAFVGDAVYSLYVREGEVLSRDAKLIELQKRTSKKVSAVGQSELLKRIEKLFTEEEEEIYHRGRNAKKTTRSKSASVTDYNRSTGFEAVLGFLYLCGRCDRITQLLGGDSDEN